MLKGVGPFAVFLHRRVAMTASVLVPATDRVVSPGPHVVLLPRLCQRAAAVGEHALAELLDWAEIAWTGRTSQRYFYARRALPEPVYRHLHDLVTRHGAVMRRVTGSLVLRARAEHLRAETDRLASVDHTFTRQLFVKPVEAVLHDLSRGVIDDHGLLEHPPEMLVSRVNVAHRGQGNLAPVPSNGKRWPVLVKNAAEVCELVRYLLEIAAEHTWHVPDVSAPPLDRLDPVLVPVVEALLFASPDLDAPRIDADDSWVTRVAAEALTLVAGEHRHLIALAARGAGVPEEVTGPALEPLERIRERADMLFRGLAQDPDGEGEDLHSLILDALVRGDLPDAQQGLDMLEELDGRTAVEVRAMAVQQALATLGDGDGDGVRLHLRTVELHLERGDLRAAESYVAQAEQALPGDPEPACQQRPQDAEPTAALAEPKQPPATAQVDTADIASPVNTPDTVHDDELPARILAAFRTPTHQTADRGQLEWDVGQLGRSGPLSDVVSTARELLHLAPELVVELTDLALHRARPVLYPSLWQLQYDALRSLGQTERAESVFRRGHPPLPPQSLTVGESVPGAHLLTPYVRPFRGADVTAEAGGGPGAGPRTQEEEARLYARSLEAGNTAALGYAIGWAVRAGRAADALHLYRRFGPHQYLNGAAAWNIAAAYAAVGSARQALQALDVFQDILSGRMEPNQRRAMREFMALHGARPAPEPAFQGAPGTGTGPMHPEEEAKHLHAMGRAQEAAARLEQLLTVNPRSPGAFLLLRIHREGNNLAGARSVVDRIEAAGVATWRHHLELARNALEAGDVALAQERLDRAQQMGATADWTEKLLHQLRAQPAGRVEIRLTPVPATGVAPPPTSTNDIEAWRKYFAAQLGTRGLQDVLETTTWASLREPVIVGVLTTQLRTLGIPVPRADITERLIGLVNQCRDSFLSRDLALWLINGCDHRTAVRVLQDCVAWTPPERLPRVVFLRDEAVRRGGLPQGSYDPPSPPAQVTSVRRAVDPSLVPEVHVQEIGGPQAADLLIHEAQQLPPNTEASLVADAWLRAVHHGHSLALGNALATLVLADRAEEAVAFYHSVSDRYWLGSSAAWNLGCAYMASGHLEEAATTFEYHARVSTWSYTDEQRRVLTALFESVGRPVPTPAGSKLLLARGGNARPGTGEQAVAALGDGADSAEGEAARRIAQCSSAPTSHNFYYAGTAVRRAMQSRPSGNVARYLATMRNLFALVTDLNPKAVAEMAAVLETAGRAEEAWNLLRQWIDRTRAAPALLALAVRISRELGHEGELRRLLERHQRPNSSYEVYLSLAKLAQRQNDEEALLKYADLALQRNRRSVEAAVLRESAAALRQALPVGDRGVLAKVKNPRVSVNQAIQQLVHEYDDQVRDLRLKALTWFQPKVDKAELNRLLSTTLRAQAKPAFQAATDEDWETATRLFKELLKKHPRDVALARATVACQLKCGMVDDAAAVAGVLGHIPDGVRLQVQVACAQGDYNEAGRLLGLFLTLHDGSAEEAIVQAGLLTHLANRASVAPKLLLEFARRRQPGTSDLPLAIAVVLANQQRKRDLAREALQELRRPRNEEPDALIARAIEYDVPDILNDTAIPPLGRGHLERIVEHLRMDTPRLLRFLQDHIKLRATALDSTVVREARGYCATLLAEHGLVRDAYSVWRGLVESAATAEEKGNILHELRSFCDRISYAEGYRYAIVTLPELGIEPSDEDLAYVDNMSSEMEPQALPEETTQLVQAVVVRRCASLAEALTSAVDQLKVDAGPQDAIGLEKLRKLWTRLAEQFEDPDSPSRLAGRTTRDLVESATRVESDMYLQRQLAKNLISTARGEAAVSLSRALQEAWDEVARHHLKSGGTQRWLDLTVHRATRLGSGPVEVKVEITSFRQPLKQVTVRVDKRTLVVGDLEPHSSATRRLVLPGEAQEVKVTASGLQDGKPTEKTQTAPVTRYPHDQRLAARFNPSDPVDPELFVGRTKELEDLTHHYEKAARTNTRALFMTGSRQAGKTSIAHQLSEVRPPGAAELPPPSKWRIPRVFPVYLNAEMTADADGHLMTDIAKAVALAVNQAFSGQAPDVGMPEGAGSLDFLRWWRDVRQRLWQDNVGLLLILDEFQHLLRQLKQSGTLESALSDLRGLKNRGDLALLFCGAATTNGIRELLEGTRFQQEFTTPYLIGPLDMEATLQAFHQGFLPPVDVMPQAAARVWAHTKGHPQHIHMLGSRVLELLHDGQRVIVDTDLVDKAFDRVVADDDAVISLLDPYVEGRREQALELLYEIAELIDEGASDAAVKAQLGTAKFKDLEALRAFGILVKAQDEWQWINQIVRTWLDTRRPRNPDRTQSAWQPDEEALRSAGYVVVSRVDDGVWPKTCLLRHDNHKQPLLARHHPGHRATLARLNEILFDPTQNVAGVPEMLSPCGDWLLFRAVEGVSLRQKLDAKLAGSAEISPVNAARWIADACDTLHRMLDARQITHGNLRPENLVLVGEDPGELHVLGWGSGTDLALGQPLLPARHPSDYAPPEARDGTSPAASPQDDVFALSAILYQLLHPSGALPYADQESFRFGPPALPGYGLLNSTVWQAVSKRPDARFPSALELRNALEEAVLELQHKDRRATRVPVGAPSVTPPVTLSGTAQTELRRKLDHLTEVIEFLTASLTGDEENDVIRDHSHLIEAVRAEALEPHRIAKFARRLRETLASLGTPSPAIRMVDEILEVALS
ncbi:hypothetical protein [Microbispora hainanensis]|uniref:Protein kinase domain-containing protein n=1 Tax=Microbispora hainanensis TaxID=568844 RepID=A0A544YN08_9ACTN|nr:hypothetical protein [Microbispora hainanensis]TQS17942.1 hypothetical protein FLX08_26655 [Microbispora hainanensis]